ncbi:MAG: hypothetical protein KAR42_17015 [candidate division Zixibacteria bacterium]|nr:hypothetical protein [candidate division Zixibacteria bacterium]
MEQDKIKILETEALTLPERAKLIQVVDDESLHKANEFIHACRQMRKKIAETMDPIIKRAHGLWKEVLGQKQKLDASPKQGEETVGPRIASYKRKIEEEARALEEEKQRKIEEEKKKKEEAFEKAAALERAGDHDRADEEYKKAEASEEEETKLVELPKVEVKLPETKGTSIKKIWKYRVKNLKLVPRPWLKLDEAKVGAAVRSSQGKVEITGIETYSVDSISIREG